MQTTQLFTRFLLIASVLFGAQTAHSGELDEIKLSLIKLVGARALTSKISESPMPGVYQVDLGNRIVYVSKVGDHMLLGDVFDTSRGISLSEEIKQEKALLIIDEIQESEMIVFAPAETKRTITVYTDVDCPYCRKLHKEVPTLVDNGVKVRYLWYPRSGVNTPSYDKAVSIWCAEDQLDAMNDAKLNNKISSLKCDPNPVASQYQSGKKVGVRGTPTIVFDDGTIVGGYLPAKDLLSNLGIDSASVAKATQ
jgi:thiol:disulfide interchange protein DsbC